jgi:hypothetical protein
VPLNTSRAPSKASPLWIIALFIALSEVTAGVASITTDGAARMLFAIFAVAFPVGVFVTFVWLLINHAPHLYPPGEYSESITPEIYAAGISRHRRTEVRVIAKAMAEVLGDPAAGRQAELVDQFEQVVVSSSVEVEIDAVVPGGSPVLFAVDEDTRVRDLLDELYFSMSSRVKAFHYLKSWVLVTQDGRLLDEIGTAWARRHGQAADERRLADAGILPGTKLGAIPYPLS